jgi:hypothetical protein
MTYITNLLRGGGERKLGHNPASSWSALAMISLALGLAITGILMAQGERETFEDLHELLANSFALVVIGHVAGVALHSLRHRDAIGLSMFHGRKQNITGRTGIANSYPVVALAFVAIMTVFGMTMLKGYDPNTKILQVFGAELQLGEPEEGDDGHDDTDDDEDDQDD